MYNIYRISISAINCNPLAGFATNGPSMMAIFGMVTAFELKTNYIVDGFGLVLNEYDDRLNQRIKPAMDQELFNKQRGNPSRSAERHADYKVSLYLKTENYLDIPTVVEAFNQLRLQGGVIDRMITENDISFLEQATEDALIEEILREPHKLGTVYLKTNTDYDTNVIEKVANLLTDESTENVLMCTGYVVHDKKKLPSGELINIAEPAFTVCELMRVYQLKSKDKFSADKFFFEFDKLSFDKNNNAYLLK